MEDCGGRPDNIHIMRRRNRQSGQAAVETAIVMPLFVFILLGTVQLGLMHQARLLTKYAAYKATRAGSLQQGELKAIENAAVAVMIPMLSKQSPRHGGDGEKQPQHWVYNVSDPGKYKQAYNEVVSSRSNTAFGKKMVEVTICNPIGNGAMNKDFDDYKSNTGDWKGFDNTKLAVQVTTYLPLYIPYANAFIWWAARGENTSTGRAQTMKNLRMKTGDTSKRSGEERKSINNSWTLKDLQGEAEKGNYIMPIRASFAMRMMSNFKSNPPGQNECHIAWEKKK